MRSTTFFVIVATLMAKLALSAPNPDIPQPNLDNLYMMAAKSDDEPEANRA